MTSVPRVVLPGGLVENSLIAAGYRFLAGHPDPGLPGALPRAAGTGDGAISRMKAGAVQSPRKLGGKSCYGLGCAICHPHVRAVRRDCGWTIEPIA